MLNDPIWNDSEIGDRLTAAEASIFPVQECASTCTGSLSGLQPRLAINLLFATTPVSVYFRGSTTVLVDPSGAACIPGGL
jgi:hypothetical protein